MCTQNWTDESLAPWRWDKFGNGMAKELLRATDAKKNLEVRVTGRWTGTLAWFGRVVGMGAGVSVHVPQKLRSLNSLSVSSSLTNQ